MASAQAHRRLSDILRKAEAERPQYDHPFQSMPSVRGPWWALMWGVYGQYYPQGDDIRDQALPRIKAALGYSLDERTVAIPSDQLSGFALEHAPAEGAETSVYNAMTWLYAMAGWSVGRIADWLAEQGL